MAAVMSQEEENGLRLRLLLEEGSSVFLQRLFKEINVTPLTFHTYLQTKEKKLLKLQTSSKSFYTAAHHAILFPSNGNALDTRKIDISLTYQLFRNLTTLKGPWGPRAPSGSIQKSSEHLRDLRNQILHGELPLAQSDFTVKWNELLATVADLGGDVAKMNGLLTVPIDNTLLRKLNLAEQNLAQLKDALNNTFHEVPKLIPNFVGRVEEVNEIHSYFESGGKELLVLSGEGGVGKSETALKYIEVYRETAHDNNVVWVNAESLNSLSTSFIGLAEKLKILDGNQQIKAAISKCYSFYSGNSRKALFVFDNADDISIIKMICEEFLPTVSTSYVKILVTSVMKDWINWGYELLDINTFSRETAESFIKNELRNEQPPVENEMVPLLAEKLSCLPLALQQCMSYMKRHHLTIFDYLQLFDQNFDILFSKELPKYGKTVVKCCKISLGTLSSEASKILYTVSVLGKNKVRGKLLNNLENLVCIDVTDAIAELDSRSLIKYDGNFIAMHFLTRFIILKLLEQDGLITQYAETAMQLLCAAIENEAISEQHYNYGDGWIRYITSLASEYQKDYEVLLLLIDKIDNIFASYDNKEMFFDAEYFFRSLREAIKNTKPLNDSPKLLKCVEMYIYYALLKQKKCEDAISCYETFNQITIDDKTRLKSAEGIHFDDLSEKNAKNMNEKDYAWKTFLLLCDTHRNRTAFNRSEFIDWYNRMFVINDNFEESSLLNQFQLCWMIYFEGHYDDALTKLRLLKPAFISSFGLDHELTVQLCLWMICCMSGQGDDESTEKEFDTLIERSTFVFGSHHWLTYRIQLNYCLHFNRLHEYEEARTRLSDLYDQQKEALGTRHRETIATVCKLDSCLRKIIKLQEENCKKDIQSERRTNSRSSSGGKRCNTLESISANEQLQRIHETQYETLEALNEQAFFARFRICGTLYDEEKYAQARDEFEKLYKLQLKALGERHVDTMKSYYWHCRCLLDLKQLDLAREGFEWLHNLQVNVLGENHKNYIRTLHWYCKCLLDLKQFEFALDKLKKLHALDIATLGEGHCDTMKTLYRYCMCLYELEQFQQARDELEKLRNLQVSNLDENESDTMNTSFLFCMCLYELKELELARKEFKKLHRIQVDTLGAHHKDTMTSFSWYQKCGKENGCAPTACRLM